MAGRRKKSKPKSKRRHSLTVIDNRSGKRHEVPILYGTDRRVGAAILGDALHDIRLSGNDHGLLCFDPFLSNTAICKSAITFLDAERGVLLYRGYPVGELADHGTYTETAYLLIHGELPSAGQLDAWNQKIMAHSLIHENVKKFIDGFHYDAHPMGILVGTISALSTFYPDAKDIRSDELRELHQCRLIAKMTTLAALAYRHAMGLPEVYPNRELSYTGNLLNMVFNIRNPEFKPNRVFERALDVLFILHADHEQNASTTTVRQLASCRIDPYTAVAGGCAALYGQLQGSENVGVINMLKKIGSTAKVGNYLKEVKAGRERLMGFGHRAYKSYDPRAKVAKALAFNVFEVTGENPLLSVALEVEKQALADPYFSDRDLFPNVHFHTGLIYQSMGFPVSMIPVLFAIGRTAGWLAQWQELVSDPDQKIARPRQIYAGPRQRPYVPIERRA